MNFLMVIMASGIARGRVRTTTTATESRNMAAILQILGWQRHAALVQRLLLRFDIAHPCYDQLTLVKTRYPLTSFTWPYRGMKWRALINVTCLSKLTADQLLVCYWIAGSCQVNLLQTDNLVLSTRLIMWIGLHKEIRELTFRALGLRRSKGLTLETSAPESLYGGQFTLSTQLIKPNYLAILPPTQHHSFFRNLPPFLVCRKQGRIVRKPVNASPGLKFIRIITFSSIQMFFADLFCDYKTQTRKSNSKQKTSPQSYKTQMSILPFPGLAQSSTEQPGQGATLLGWPKSIYYSV